MKILLAPSESKKSGGREKFNLDALLFDILSPKRRELLDRYNAIIEEGKSDTLNRMFGLKKLTDIQKYRSITEYSPAMKAIERYNGVAFGYLDYADLDDRSKSYIDEHVILFSNLFGPIRASDLIPEYRLKQGASVGNIKTEKFYHEHSADLMEAYLSDEEILDLRAGYYDKFYKPAKTYTTLKFVKEGKAVSHWAKAYRGIVLREISRHKIESMEAFMKLPAEGLHIVELQHRKNRTEIIYEIE